MAAGATEPIVLIATVDGVAHVQALHGPGPFKIGRDETCHAVVADASISRTHAVLSRSPLTLTDQGSRNGTFVEGQRIQPNVPTPIMPGKSFRLGDVTAFLRVVQAQDNTETQDPAAAARGRSMASVVAEDPRMRMLFERLDLVAPSELNLLLLGETGVGKEVLAQAIHERSGRTGAFLALNCAALPETILEGELFGHERGAFTGAVADKKGLLEAAHGGTLFLDEIGELPLATQAKLLRVVESGEVLRIGARKATHVDLRFIGATHRNLKDMVRDGTFRQDLMYRIDGFSLKIPPLRERPKDIAPLSRLFIAKSKRPSLRVSDAALAVLAGYSWPGNIRELRNVMGRAVVLAQGDTIEPQDLALDTDVGSTPLLETSAPSGAADSKPLDESVRAFERDRIREALAAAGGSKTKAYRMKELGMLAEGK
jgi:transcriptional regulator with PAS, ATPase and Fis domain